MTLAVRVTPEQAVQLGVSRLSGDTLEQNLQLPAVQNLLRQSRAALWGLLFVGLGTLFQIVGAWPRSVS